MNGLAPGSAANQRIGQRVTFKSIEFRFRVVATGTMIASMNRWMILLDKQPNGAIPALTDILDPPAIWGGRDLDNRKRFKIMLDKVRYSASVGGDPSRIYVHTYMKLRRPIVTDYNTGTSGTVADISTNSIVMILFGDNAANYPVVDKLWYRLRYTDN